MRRIGLFHSRQGGQSLIIVILMLALGSLLTVPLLNWMNSGIKTVRLYEGLTARTYAADAGIQEGLWKIKTGMVPAGDFSQTYPAFTVNGHSVVVYLESSWILEGIVDPRIGPHSVWLDITTSGNAVYNAAGGYNEYTITLQKASTTGNKKVDYMGVWLPVGYQYVTDSCRWYSTNVEKTRNPVITKMHGGTSIVWSDLNYSFRSEDSTATQKFRFTPVGKIPRGDVPWVASQSSDIGASWDGSVRNFRIISTATDPSTGKTTRITANVNLDGGPGGVISIITYELQ